MSFTARASAFARLLLVAFVVAVGFVAPSAAHANGIDRIVVFGDSLSDPGNAFALSGGQIVGPPDYGMDTPDELVTLIPSAPYASHRFSNGPTWVELLGTALGAGASVRPAVAGALFGTDDGRASNYAFGGATAGDIGASQFPLVTQVDLFLADVRGAAPSDALYVVAIGGNDIRAAFGAVVDNDPNTSAEAVIGTALQAVAANVGRLYQAGARRFVIWNAPDLGRTPALRRLDAFVAPGAAGLASTLSAAYNAQFALVLQGLAALPGIEIVPFDAFSLLSDVQANPARFHLRDATNACIQPNNAPLYRCANPDRHFFWDGIHPTRAGHAIIAFLVGKALVSAVLQDD